MIECNKNETNNHFGRRTNKKFRYLVVVKFRKKCYHNHSSWRYLCDVFVWQLNNTTNIQKLLFFLKNSGKLIVTGASRRASDLVQLSKNI